MHYDAQKIHTLTASLDELIGAEELKRYIRETIAVYAHMSDQVSDTIFSRALLLSINEGDGLFTWLDRLTEMWQGLLSLEDLYLAFYTLKLPVIDDAKDIKKTSKRDIVLAAIDDDGLLSFSGIRVLCVDISKWVDHVEDGEFRSVLARLRLTMQDQMLVFRLPAVDEVTLARVRQAIEWFMNVDDVYCPPCTIEDYCTYAMRWLDDHEVLLEGKAKEELFEIIANERRKVDFCGFKSVRRLLDDLTFSVLMKKKGEAGGQPAPDEQEDA